MFGLDLSEFALIGVVALLFIGPKDMPVAIRTVTGLIKKGRKLATEFQGHVEEMIKDADLGDARDQFRQLRSLNVRGQLMKALDSDGSLRETLTKDPLAEMRAPGVTPPVQTLPPAISIGTRREHGVSMAGDMPIGVGEQAVLDAKDPAPHVLPPRRASRLQVLRAKPDAPAFVPPHAARNLPPAARPPVRPEIGV